MSRGTNGSFQSRGRKATNAKAVSDLRSANAAVINADSPFRRAGAAAARGRKLVTQTPSPPSSANTGGRTGSASSGGRRQIKGGALASDQQLAVWNDFYDDSSAGPESAIKFIDVPRSLSSQQHEASGGPSNLTFTSREQILEKCGESEYSQVYEIDLRACNLTALPSLETFTRLRVLDLSSNKLSTLESVKHNKDLRDLKLYDNRFIEIRGLEGLSELSSLQLQHNHIKSIGQGLGSLRKLKQLRLDSNSLLKVSANELAGCVQLTYLDLSHNKIESLAAVTSLPNLQELYASDNCIRTLPDLSVCRKLEEIDLSSNKLTELSGLKGAASLMTLRLSRNYLTKADSMGTLNSVRDLYLEHNQITVLAPLTSLVPNLEVLDVSENKITSWSEVATLSVLQCLHELSVSGNPFCVAGGEKPSYHLEAAAVFPALRVLNRAVLQRGDTDKLTMCAPPMRPMSAAFVVTSRQVESQIAVAEACIKDFEASLEAKFSALRSSVQSLPIRVQATSPSGAVQHKRPSSKHGARSRLMEARLFAEHSRSVDPC